MQKLIATQEFPYAGVPLKPGDAFEASDEDARMLMGFGKARAQRRQQSDLLDRQPALQTANMKSEGEANSTRRDRGRYRRTDMRSED